GGLRRARGILAGVLGGGRGARGLPRARPGAARRRRPGAAVDRGRRRGARRRRGRLPVGQARLDGPCRRRRALRRAGDRPVRRHRRRPPAGRRLRRRRGRAGAGRRLVAAEGADRAAAQADRRAHRPGADPRSRAAVRGPRGKAHRHPCPAVGNRRDTGAV
ncbi:MAG: hypothetical protein AVDCRST_MAG52-2377, partial [uncultured Blastococcus sp.]